MIKKKYFSLMNYFVFFVILFAFISLTCIGADDLQSLCRTYIDETEAKTSPEVLKEQVKNTQEIRECETAEAWSLIGAGCVGADRVEPALYCFAQAVKNAPEEALHLNNLGFLLLDQKRDDEAEVFLEKAYELAPESSEVLMNLGKLRWQQGRKEEGLQFMEQGAEDEEQPQYSHSYAKALHQSDQSERAAEVLEQNLSLHPDHQSSLDLYQEITGEQWKESAKKLAEEALELASEAQDFVQQWAQVVDRIAAQSGGIEIPEIPESALEQMTDEQRQALEKTQKMAAQPTGSLMAQFHVNVSKVFAGTVQAAMNNPGVTNEQLAAQVLQCYGVQIQTFAKMYHAFYVSAFIWDRFSPRPHFKFYIVGGHQFKHDQSLFNKELYDYLNAGDCPQIVPAATAYVKAMPPRFERLTNQINRALNQIKRLDAELLDTYDDFYLRIQPLLQGGLYKRMGKQNEDLMHNFFDPSTTTYEPPTSILPLDSEKEELKKGLMPPQKYDTTPMGIRWCIDTNKEQLEDFVEYHQGHMKNAMIDLADCGSRVDEEEVPADIEQLIMDMIKEAQDEGTVASVSIDFIICDFSVGTDGVVQMSLGQVAQGVVYYNTFNDTWGLKAGGGVSLENPGPVAVGADVGSYIVYDSSKGLGSEFTYSGTVGGVQITHTDPVWFSSLL